MTTPSAAPPAAAFQGNDRLLFGMIAGLVTFWLFAQTMLNVAPDMRRDLGVASIEARTASAPSFSPS